MTSQTASRVPTRNHTPKAGLLGRSGAALMFVVTGVVLSVLATGCGKSSNGGTAGGPRGGVAPAARQISCPAGGQTVSNAVELRRALHTATPGMVIRMTPGTYEGGFELAASGTEAAPIWVCGPREAIIDGLQKTEFVFHVKGASWANLVGFSVRGGTNGVMADGMQHGVIANLSVSATGYEAIHLRTNSSDNLVQGNVVRDTGNARLKFGEGIYVGSATSNWCRFTACGPDRSDRNSVIGNDIADVTAEAIDIKEGTTGGVVADNVMSADRLVEADSFIDVKGNGWTVRGNRGEGGGAIEDGIQVHVIKQGWGEENMITANELVVNGPGYGIYIQKKDRHNLVGCDNQVTGVGEGLSNIRCQ